jgi:hypothetical protein
MMTGNVAPGFPPRAATPTLIGLPFVVMVAEMFVRGFAARGRCKAT